MKTMILTMMMLLGVYANAKPASHYTKNKNVSFKIIVDETIKKAPYVVIYEQGVYRADAAMVGQRKIQPTVVKGNTYFFDLKQQNRPLYFSVLFVDKKYDVPAIEEYHFEPGDHIEMLIKPTKISNKFDLTFSGAGSAKYQCQNEFYRNNEMVETAPTFTRISGYKADNSNVMNVNRLYNLIERYKPQMSVYSYNLLHADVLGRMGFDIFDSLRNILHVLKSKSDTIGFNNIVKSFRSQFTYDFTENVPDSVLSDSKNYSEFLLARYSAETVMDYGSINFKAMFKNISKVDNHPLRDKLILTLFINHWSQFGDDFDYFLNDSLGLIKDKNILARIKAFDNNRVGSIAQNFKLADSRGKMVSLSDFKGKVVFIDFWYTGCGACKLYYQNVLSKVEEHYANNANVVFITICPDSKEDWLESLEKGKHTSLKAINLYTNGERFDHEIIKSYNVKAYPRPIVISKKGKIACVNNKVLRNLDGLVSTIEKELIVAN